MVEYATAAGGNFINIVSGLTTNSWAIVGAIVLLAVIFLFTMKG